MPSLEELNQLYWLVVMILQDIHSQELRAPQKPFRKGKPVVTTWLTEMSHWIRMSKVLESDLWDVMAIRMSGGALT